MNINQLHAQLDADFGGPAFLGVPSMPWEKAVPHKGGGGSSTSSTEIPKELKPLANA